MKVLQALLVRVIFVLCVVMMGSSSWAAETGGTCVQNPAPAGAKGKRVAVVVGDGAYANGIPALPNPTNDAEATAKAIGALGFQVFLSTNADSATLQRCLDQAYAGLDNADVALFYYSGHGIQIQDQNYLVATDAGTKDLKHGFVAVQPIVDALQKHAKATLVLLDACRNNPLTEGGQAGLSVSTGRGLGRVTDTTLAAAPAVVQAHGLLVAYSTSPNAVALDGAGRLSPFTAAFDKAVGTSGYSIQRVLGEVTKAVGEETDWAQTPWMKSSLTEELKLGGGETLAEARSISDNHAARATTLLETKGEKREAIIEALKGLPASPDEAALTRFPKAYLALYTAMQSHDVTLPLSPGHSVVAVSTQDRVAVFKQSDTQTGTFELWSASEQKVVATLGAGKGVYKFTFSPHGRFLAIQADRAISVYNGLDGTKLFEVRAASFATALEFSPDEGHLMIAGDGLAIVDVATGKPMTIVKPAQLSQGARKRGSAILAQATFGGNDAICYILNTGDISKGTLGVFDLKQNKPTHLRDTDDSVTVMMCDPAGKYMVRNFSVGSGEQGLEIWDLAQDKVSKVKEQVLNILGLDPKGDYASVLVFNQEAQGTYDLANAKKGHPPTVPDDYSISGSRVFDTAGRMVNQDLNNNPWRDWPDETLFGPALVAKAMAGLTDAQREAIARERITFTVVAGNP